jgi:hypothetical protein
MIIKNNDWINDLKVGDKVNVRWGSIYVVREVTRITATQIIFVTPNGAILKFNKKTADEVAPKKKPYNRDWIAPFTGE